MDVDCRAFYTMLKCKCWIYQRLFSILTHFIFQNYLQQFLQMNSIGHSGWIAFITCIYQNSRWIFNLSSSWLWWPSNRSSKIYIIFLFVLRRETTLKKNLHQEGRENLMIIPTKRLYCFTCEEMGLGDEETG